MNKKNILFVVIGLLIISITQIILHYTKLPDFVTGSFIGIGIGIIVIALIKTKKTAIT